jgi:hypothetical protein
MASLDPDGCSFFPEGKQTACCNAHDIAYSFGNSRLEADRALRECVKACGKPYMAWVLFIGVRLFGYFAWRKAQNTVKRRREKGYLP